jgi:hypothetical protein
VLAAPTIALAITSAAAADSLIDFMARSPIDGERAKNIRLSTRDVLI